VRPVTALPSVLSPSDGAVDWHGQQATSQSLEYSHAQVPTASAAPCTTATIDHQPRRPSCRDPWGRAMPSRSAHLRFCTGENKKLVSGKVAPGVRTAVPSHHPHVGGIWSLICPAELQAYDAHNGGLSTAHKQERERCALTSRVWGHDDAHSGKNSGVPCLNLLSAPTAPTG